LARLIPRYIAWSVWLYGSFAVQLTLGINEPGPHRAHRLPLRRGASPFIGGLVIALGNLIFQHGVQ
jgi:hypothetical protein